jgi:site-specific DNA-adenine methylase
VPHGKYDRRYYDPANLAAFGEFLGSFELRVGDFEAALAEAEPDGVVFLDPPFQQRKMTPSTGYNIPRRTCGSWRVMGRV